LPTALPGTDASAPPGASGSGDGAAAPLPSGASTDPAVAWSAFAACLRSHGLDVPDPEIDENGEPAWTTSFDLKRAITEQIRDDCAPLIAAVSEGGGAGTNHPRKSYSFDSQVAHAACMREHGLTDWPDPDPNALDSGMPAGFDKANPTVLAGLIACESLLVETTASPSPAL
jgi:hypothetical protein